MAVEQELPLLTDHCENGPKIKTFLRTCIYRTFFCSTVSRSIVEGSSKSIRYNIHFYGVFVPMSTPHFISNGDQTSGDYVFVFSLNPVFLSYFRFLCLTNF